MIVLFSPHAMEDALLEDIINFTMEQITILALYLRKISILYWICI